MGGGAYKGLVDDDVTLAKAHQSESTLMTRRRRRPPNPVEHAKRVAWGHRYGNILKVYVERQRERGTW